MSAPKRIFVTKNIGDVTSDAPSRAYWTKEKGTIEYIRADLATPLASPGLTELEGSQENYVKVGESGRWFQVGFPDAVPPWDGKDRTVRFGDYEAAINHGKILWEEIQRIRDLIRFPILPTPAAPPSPSREGGIEASIKIVHDFFAEQYGQDNGEDYGPLEATFDVVAAEVRRLREVERAQAWLPIETAPRDGRRILICWLDENGYPDIYIRRFETEIGDFTTPSGFIPVGTDAMWMPLPPNPGATA